MANELAVTNLPQKAPDANDASSLIGFNFEARVEFPPGSGKWHVVGRGIVMEAGWHEDIQPVGADALGRLEYEHTGIRTMHFTVRR